MNRKMIFIAAALLILAAAYLKMTRRQHDPRLVPSEVQFSLPDLNGQPIDSAKLRGQVVLVDFWATWCVPCESEIPHLVEWQSKYGGQGLQVVGISMDDTASPVKPFAEKHKINYPIAMSDEKTIAAFGGVLGLPANILVGRDGKVLAKHVGVTDINVLEQEVQRALTSK